MIRMRKRKSRWNRNLAKLVIGLRNVWEIKLQMYMSQIDWALRLAFWCQENLAGLQTWKGSPLFLLLWNDVFWTFKCHCDVHDQIYCRLMKAQAVGDTTSLEFMRSRRVFEINPDHPIIRNLNVWWVEDNHFSLSFVAIKCSNYIAYKSQ